MNREEIYTPNQTNLNQIVRVFIGNTVCSFIGQTLKNISNILEIKNHRSLVILNLGARIYTNPYAPLMCYFSAAYTDSDMKSWKTNQDKRCYLR